MLLAYCICLISAEDDKQTVSTDNDKQPDEATPMINVVTYDYLPQGRILTFIFANVRNLFIITK